MRWTNDDRETSELVVVSDPVCGPALALLEEGPAEDEEETARSDKLLFPWADPTDTGYTIVMDARDPDEDDDEDDEDADFFDDEEDEDDDLDDDLDDDDFEDDDFEDEDEDEDIDDEDDDDF